MRFALALILLACAFTARTGAAQAAVDAPAPQSETVAAAGVDIDIDDDDDNVFEVQLVVLGIVIASVFVLGTGAWLLRRKLGLTAYTPPADSGHH